MDRLLTLRDAAELLQINQRTALRLANAGEIPAARVGGQWRIHPLELERWFLDSRKQPDPGEEAVGLFDHDLTVLDHPAATVLEVFEAIADRLAFTGQLIYPRVYREALREREEMMSTGVGSGVAIPHARHIINGLFRAPLCLFLSLAEPIAWHSIDDKPVDLVFAVAAPTNSLHLSALASVMKVTRNVRVCAGLRQEVDPERALAALRRAVS